MAFVPLVVSMTLMMRMALVVAMRFVVRVVTSSH